MFDIPSAPLAEIVGCEKESRPQVVKKLWVYIKDKELQNPSNKREIIADDKFRAVFSVDKIDMFQMNKKLGACVDHVFPSVLCLTVLQASLPRRR